MAVISLQIRPPLSAAAKFISPRHTVNAPANLSFRLKVNYLCSSSSHTPLDLKTSSFRASTGCEVTKDTWEELVLNSNTPVLVEFYANWCGPCQMVHELINEIEEEYRGKLKCLFLNTDENSCVAEMYEIKAVPVVLLIKNGKKTNSIAGTMPKEFYISAIEETLNSP